MADINIQDLAQVLQTLARQTSSVSSEIRTAAQIISEMEDPLKAAERIHAEHVKKLKKLTSDEAKQRVDILEDLRRNKALTEREIAARQKEIQTIEASIDDAKKAIRRQQAAAKKAEKTYGKLDDATTSAYEKLNALKKQVEDLRNAKAGAEKAEKQHAQNLSGFNNAIVDQAKALKAISWKEAAANIGKTAAAAVGNGIRKAFTGVSFSAGIESQYSSMTKEYRTGVNIGSMTDALQYARYGLSPGEMVDLSKTNRKGVIAAGGPAGARDLMGAVGNQLKSLMPSQDVGRYTMLQLQTLANAGIKPTVQSLMSMNTAFEKSRKAYGQSAADFAATMGELTSSKEVQSQLAVLTDREREAMLKSISLRYAENAQLGLSIEQNKQILLQQSKEAMKGPLSNLSAAIKQASLGAVLGVQIDPRYVQEMMKAPGQRNEQLITSERQRITSAAQSGQSGRLGDSMRYLLEAISPKLDQDQLLTGGNSIYSTSLAKVAELTPENTAALGELKDSNKELITAISTLTNTLNKAPIAQMLGGALSGLGSAIYAAAGAIVGAASVIATTNGGGGILDILTKGKSRGGKAAGGGMLGKLGKLGKFGKAIPYVGGALTLGLAASQYSQGNTGTAIGGALGGILGGAVGTLGGPLGTVAGGIAGDALGSYIGGMFDGDGKGTTPPLSPANAQGNELLENATKQTKLLGEHGEYLKQVATQMPKLIEVSQKQLEVMAATSAGGRSSEAVKRIMNSNKFSPAYTTL